MGNLILIGSGQESSFQEKCPIEFIPGFSLFLMRRKALDLAVGGLPIDEAVIGLAFLGSAGLTGTVFRVGGRRDILL